MDHLIGKTKLRNLHMLAISTERDLIRYMEQNPDRHPDGSFGRRLIQRGFDVGRQLGRREASVSSAAVSAKTHREAARDMKADMLGEDGNG